MLPLTDDTTRQLLAFLVHNHVEACVDLEGLYLFEEELAAEMAHLMPNATESDVVAIPRGMIAGALRALANAFEDPSNPSPLKNGKA
jgi:hypothetical protein